MVEIRSRDLPLYQNPDGPDFAYISERLNWRDLLTEKSKYRRQSFLTDSIVC